jgi:dihydrofolate reductase
MQISLIAAIAVDGFIGRSKTDRSFDWTSKEDKSFYIEKLKEAEAIVIGRRTFETFTRYPKNSHWSIYTSKIKEFKNPRPEIITAEATDLAPAELLEKLKAAGKEKILVCGGASVYSMFMKSGLVDKLYLTVEPVLFGSGVKLFGDDLGQIDLDLVETHQLSKQTIVLEYDVRK